MVGMEKYLVFISCMGMFDPNEIPNKIRGNHGRNGKVFGIHVLYGYV